MTQDNAMSPDEGIETLEPMVTARLVIAGDEIHAGLDAVDAQPLKDGLVLLFKSRADMDLALRAGCLKFKWET